MVQRRKRRRKKEERRRRRKRGRGREEREMEGVPEERGWMFPWQIVVGFEDKERCRWTVELEVKEQVCEWWWP